MDFEISVVQFFNYFKNFATSWKDVNKTLDDSDFGSDINMKNPYQEEVAAIKAKGLSPQETLNEIISLVHSKINWNGTRNLFSTNVKDAIKKGAGSSADKNYVLAAALKDARFSIVPILLNPRDKGRMPRVRPSYDKVNSFVLQVTMPNNKIVYVDGADEHSSCNVLPTSLLVDYARTFTKGEGVEVNLSKLNNNNNIIQVKAAFNSKGKLEGKIINAYTNQCAYSFSKRFAKYKSLEEFTEKEESGNSVSIDSMIVDRLNTPRCKEEYNFTKDVDSTDSLKYINLTIIPLISDNPFKEETRILPIEFNYAENYRIGVILDIPEGYRIAEIPKPVMITACNYSLSYNNFKAIKKEPLMPQISDFVPLIYISPLEFRYEGNSANMSNWQQCGDWIYYLGPGRNILPPELIADVERVTKDLSTDVAKIDALYHYLGENYRYVSILLGIGGLQPMRVADTFKNKFGDCKALTFIMQAMLTQCGIKSNYVLVNTQNPIIPGDFASLAMADHVILQVPLTDDTLWLECTNTDYPIGYNHEDIAGHDVIVIKSNGKSEVVKIPAYPDSLNLDIRNTTITLDSNGGAKATVEHKANCREYEYFAFLQKVSKEKQLKFCKKNIGLSEISIDSMSLALEKSKIPSFKIGLEFSTPHYGTMSNTRQFIPQDMKIETLPKPMCEDSKLGKVKLDIKALEGKIIIIQEFTLRSGRYPRKEVKNLNELFETAKSIYTSNIVLIKK